jgi:hypothetical protein
MQTFGNHVLDLWISDLIKGFRPNTLFHVAQQKVHKVLCKHGSKEDGR